MIKNEKNKNYSVRREDKRRKGMRPMRWQEFVTAFFTDSHGIVDLPAFLPDSDEAFLSDFEYYITPAVPVLVIRDLDIGGLSVTNNMPAILKTISAETHCLLAMPIIYRDSEGHYDGVILNLEGNVTYYPLVRSQLVTDEKEAINAALAQQTCSGNTWAEDKK